MLDYVNKWSPMLLIGYLGFRITIILSNLFQSLFIAVLGGALFGVHVVAIYGLYKRAKEGAYFSMFIALFDFLYMFYMSASGKVIYYPVAYIEPILFLLFSFYVSIIFRKGPGSNRYVS
jgi:hypothetical protein